MSRPNKSNRKQWLKDKCGEIAGRLGFEPVSTNHDGEDLVDTLHFARDAEHGAEVIVFGFYKYHKLMYVQFNVMRWRPPEIPAVFRGGEYAGRNLFSYNSDILMLNPQDVLPQMIEIGVPAELPAVIVKLESEIANAIQGVWGRLWAALLDKP